MRKVERIRKENKQRLKRWTFGFEDGTTKDILISHDEDYKRGYREGRMVRKDMEEAFLAFFEHGSKKPLF